MNQRFIRGDDDMNVIIDKNSFSKMDEMTSESYMKYLGMYDANPAIGKKIIPSCESCI